MSRFRQSLFALVTALGSLGSQCDRVEPTRLPSTSCEPNTAQIAIWDGRIQKVCGCGGTNGEFANPNTALSCSFSLSGSPKTIYIHYHGRFLRHQIVSTGTPSFTSSPLYDPNSNQPIRVHGFVVRTAGTYNFRDEFDHTLFGSFVVTP